MNPTKPLTAATPQIPITVLLVDDQAIIGEAVRRMLATERDITFHHCSDPTQALATAAIVKPTVILQDLVMPDVDGLTLVKFFRANPATREVPMIVLSAKEDAAVKADAFAVGANDYLVKLPDAVELRARIRYHSKGYIALLERNAAYAALQASEQRLAREVEAASKYVRSLLPNPTAGPPRMDWRYIPCAELGGDTFGYRWLDDDHFALFLIDVSGHGLEAALFSVTIMNILNTGSLPNTDFRDPAAVLTSLNDAFQMEQYSKFATIWYGVFHRSSRRLRWSGAGHPPVLLLSEGSSTPVQLPSDGLPIGMTEGSDYSADERTIEPGSRLYLYSDGCHEIRPPVGDEWLFDDFIAFLSRPAAESQSAMDALLVQARTIHQSDLLDDDFSIIEARL